MSMHAYHMHRFLSKIEKKVSGGTHRGSEKGQQLSTVKRSQFHANKRTGNTDKSRDTLQVSQAGKISGKQGIGSSFDRQPVRWLWYPMGF